MGHIEHTRDRDAIVVAPATADFMAKVAQGLADDLLASLCLARRCPLVLAPAMNVEMWDNPATQRNVRLLREDGVLLAGPAAGDQACGKSGWEGCSSQCSSWPSSRRRSSRSGWRASACW
jgi:phosphopantothenoylcysteine decarboxylase / phosphopantothenate---cysteine ligase